MTRKNETLQSDPGEAATPAKAPSSKVATVIALLGEDGGATLDELVAATGWQPHTARAVLSGFKKKGHTVTREKVDGVSRYRIAAAAGE